MWPFRPRSERADEPDDEIPLKVVGWGPFRLPGERRRNREALERAREVVSRAEEAERPSGEDL